MQLDVGSEPYLSTAQALWLFISHTFANRQRITAMTALNRKFHVNV